MTSIDLLALGSMVIGAAFISSAMCGYSPFNLLRDFSRTKRVTYGIIGAAFSISGAVLLISRMLA